MPQGTSFLTGYEHDIFLSYAHEDELGPWTVTFQDDLRRALNLILLSKIKGKSIDVWIDQELRNNLPLTDQLKKCVQDSALLLIIMSPFYLGSAWCGNEVSWFAAAARSRIAPDRRIFVVHALPTDRASWPPALAELTPYVFFARHLKAGLELPLGTIGDEDDKAAYKAVLYNLAGQIRQQIDELLAEANPPPPPVVVPLQLPPRHAAMLPAPSRFICLEIAGAAGNAATVEKRVREILQARNVGIFSPADLGPAPRDPFQADQFLRKLMKTKAGCDGLILLRLDRTASVNDWLLDYLSEVRLMASRVRADRAAPPPLVIDAASPSLGVVPEPLSLLDVDAPNFAADLTDWVDRLPIAQEAAA
jgi:hypothetical protein